MQPASHARTLHREAIRTNERRVLVLSGPADAGYEMTEAILDELDVGIRDTIVISDRGEWQCERLALTETTEIMGRTRAVVVLDLHDAAMPNAIGRATGAVDGGGLLLLLCPDLEAWPDLRDAFDERLVVAPYDPSDVRGWFKRMFAESLEGHPGIGIVNVQSGTIVQSGRTDAEAQEPRVGDVRPPVKHAFPEAAYEACLTSDQVRVLRTCERLLTPGSAVAVAAERGRGKSSVAGLAAVCLAAEGLEVAITAPSAANVRAALDRAAALGDELGATVVETGDSLPRIAVSNGSVAYHPVESIPESTDALFVDEAAGIPVPALGETLEVDRVAYTTTLYGYEGASQGFAQRFRDRLRNGRHTVIERRMHTPIRYAPNDPIEAWCNRALLLDARPPVPDAVADITPDDVTYRRWDPDALLADRHRLRDVVGLLATAHYRTEPDDLARILDAPNLEVATLGTDGAIVAVVLLAREGSLPGTVSEDAYRGERIRGNMLPDIFINAFRDTDSAERPGLRIVRIATHPARRRQGFGSHLLNAVRGDVDSQVEWIGTGFGVTTDLVRFWAENGFVPTLIGASRNRASGVRSVIMLHRSSGELVAGHGDRLPDRLLGSLADVHRDLPIDVVLAVCEAARPMPLAMDDASWRGLAAAAFGAGRYDLDPMPARRLALHHLMGGRGNALDEQHAGLLVRKVLQAHAWEDVRSELGYPSVREARRALGQAFRVLVERYGGQVVEAERARLE